MLSTNYKYASGIELKNFRIRIYNYIFVHFSVDENVLRISNTHRLDWITVSWKTKEKGSTYYRVYFVGYL